MIDRTTAKHYTWGGTCDGWHLLSDPTLGIIEERMPSGTSEALHHHHNALQFFYVLRGTLEFELDGQTIEVSARQGIEIRPGVVHRVTNRTNADAEMLVISSPPSHGDRIVAETAL
jgi:mannose-6-phosphate isomerase-like protein (cupin superfamily)